MSDWVRIEVQEFMRCAKEDTPLKELVGRIVLDRLPFTFDTKQQYFHWREILAEGLEVDSRDIVIEQRLCASAHNFAPVQSIYRWLGDIYERTERRVSLHTRRDRVAEIVALVRKEHPYELPGVSTRTITDGNPDYLAWIAQETAPE